MATSSIFHSVKISDSAQAKSFADLLDKSYAAAAASAPEERAAYRVEHDIDKIRDFMKVAKK